MRAVKTLIYLASPMYVFTDDRYDDMIVRASAYGIVIPARGMFNSNKQWLETFKAKLDRLDRLIFFTCDEGWIGRGVLAEINYMLDEEKPVHRMFNSGKLVAWGACDVAQRNPNNWKKTMRFEGD
jgi:ABC-type uncharacterized transport system fused permease/ATPase subunit